MDDVEEKVRKRFERMRSSLNERSRRLSVATEALAIGFQIFGERFCDIAAVQADDVIISDRRAVVPRLGQRDLSEIVPPQPVLEPLVGPPG